MGLHGMLPHFLGAAPPLSDVPDTAESDWACEWQNQWAGTNIAVAQLHSFPKELHHGAARPSRSGPAGNWGGGWLSEIPVACNLQRARELTDGHPSQVVLLLGLGSSSSSGCSELLQVRMRAHCRVTRRSRRGDTLRGLDSSIAGECKLKAGILGGEGRGGNDSYMRMPT